MMTTLEKQHKSSQTTVVGDPRWARIVARDRTADGHLWYSVVTTGVYCRPSCPSRAANPENVQLYDTLEAAKASGFRPCKRCHPDGPSIDDENAAIVARACRLIEQSEEEPSLAELAKAVGRSPSYFHRLFKATTGVTPKDYAAAHRAARVRQGLDSSNSVTEAMYDAGFNSSGRFYEKSTDMLGMTPTQYRSGGVNEEIRFAVGQSSLGAILVASSKKGVASILLGDDPDELVRNLQDRFPNARLIGADRHYEALVARVVGFVEAPGLGLELPLDVRGTAFQQRVWQALQAVPVGQTLSYTDIARRIGAPKAVRAVAAACAANNLAVAIPCHRVVRNNGSLSGYAWGVKRKRELLDREATHGSDAPATPIGGDLSSPHRTIMSTLFDGIEPLDPPREAMAEGAVLLRGRAILFETEILSALKTITAQAPFRRMTTPGGFVMSVAMTNCGAAGWITDRSGYRYDPIDPESGIPWPELPDCFLDLAITAAAEAGYPDFVPDACLINRYEPGARLSLHQDKNERDFSIPIVSVSLGLPATFQFGGPKRTDPVRKFALRHGDIAVWGGRSRLCYHGVTELKDGEHQKVGRMRINLTFRGAL